MKDFNQAWSDLFNTLAEARKEHMVLSALTGKGMVAGSITIILDGDKKAVAQERKTEIEAKLEAICKIAKVIVPDIPEIKPTVAPGL